MSAMEMKINFDLIIATRFDEEAKVYVGYCPALTVYSQGRTTEEAQEATVSAVTLFLGASFERGLLHKFLCDKGFTQISTKSGDMPTEPKQHIAVSGFDNAVEHSIPLQLLASVGRLPNVPCGTSTH